MGKFKIPLNAMNRKYGKPESEQVAREANSGVITRTARDAGGKTSYLRPRANLHCRRQCIISEVHDMETSLKNVNHSGRVTKKKYSLFTARMKKIVETFKTANPLFRIEEIETFKQKLFNHVHNQVARIDFGDIERWITLHPWIIQFQPLPPAFDRSCQTAGLASEPTEHSETMARSCQTSQVSLITGPDPGKAAEKNNPGTGNLANAFSVMRNAAKELDRVGKKHLQPGPGQSRNPQIGNQNGAACQVAAEINAFLEFAESVKGSVNSDVPLEMVLLSKEDQDSFLRLTEGLLKVAKLIRFVYSGGSTVRAHLLSLKDVRDELMGSLGKLVMPKSHAELLNSHYQSNIICKTEPPSPPGSDSSGHHS